MTTKRPKAPKRVEYHVVWAAKRLGFRGWDITRDGRRIETFYSKANALVTAKSAARAEQCASLRVHGRNGKIQAEYSYPRRLDPRRTKG